MNRHNSFHRHLWTLHDWFPLVVIACMVLILAMSFYTTYNTQEQVTFTVTDKERITTSDGETVSSKYLVFTETETFENTDSLLLGKFNSSDLQGRLRIGETYNARVYGWRNPVFSMYRNIVSAEPVRE